MLLDLWAIGAPSDPHRGNGRRKPGLLTDPLLSDADHEALVRDKWEAIEQATLKEKAVFFTKPEPHVKKASKALQAGANPVVKKSFSTPVPLIIATHWPIPTEDMAATELDRIRRQSAEDAALILALAEFL